MAVINIPRIAPNEDQLLRIQQQQLLEAQTYEIAQLEKGWFQRYSPGNPASSERVQKPEEGSCAFQEIYHEVLYIDPRF